MGPAHQGPPARAHRRGPPHHARTNADTTTSSVPLGYVGFNGAIGTVHFLRHDDGSAELGAFFDEIGTLVQRPGITRIRVSGHAGCSSSAVAVLLEELCERAGRRGVALEVLPGVCGIAGE